MPKAYWIAHVTVTEPATYDIYSDAIPPIFARYGGRYIIRGGRHEIVEGPARSRHIVIEFPDYATALACYHSAEYQESMKLRLASAAAEIVVVEGCD